VEKTSDYIRTPWSLYKIRKGTPNEIFHAEFQELVNEKYNRYALETNQHSTRRRIRDQSSIFSAEQEAIIDAIQKLPTAGVRRVIFTDSLSTTMAASRNNHTKNLKTRKIRQVMDKRKGNVTLCWVPGHAGKTGRGGRGSKTSS
jgi:hypothetical protein